MKESRILILTGHSGAGKDTVSDFLKKDGLYTGITPHATRIMRTGEVEGDPYFFISVAKFQDMIDSNEFIEHASYVTQFGGFEDTAYYGTAYSSIPKDKDAVITIGVLAAIELKKQLGDRATLVYLHVDDETRTERAKARGSFDQIEWDNRMTQDHKRFADGLPEGIDVSIDNMQALPLTVAAILKATY